MSDTPRTDAVRQAAITSLVELPGGNALDGMRRFYAEDDYLHAIRLSMKLEREGEALRNIVRVLLHRTTYAQRPDGTARPTTVYAETPYGWIHQAKELGVNVLGGEMPPEPHHQDSPERGR